MKHCWECGCKLTEKFLENEGMIPFCPDCGEYRFPIFNTAVSMVVVCREKKQILMIQQYGRKNWILVAGYVNKGETAEHALERELMEEVALKADGFCFNRSRYFPNSNTLIWNFIVFVSPDQEIRTTDEVDAWQWFSYEDAPRKVKPDSLAEYFLHGWMERDEWH